MKLPVRPLDKILYQPLKHQHEKNQQRRDEVMERRIAMEKKRVLSKRNK